MGPNVGDMVVFTMGFDSDTSYSPNIGPAIVTKVNADGMSGVGSTVDLCVFAMNGMFYKFSVKSGAVGERETWHLK